MSPDQREFYIVVLKSERVACFDVMARASMLLGNVTNCRAILQIIEFKQFMRAELFVMVKIDRLRDGQFPFAKRENTHTTSEGVKNFSLHPSGVAYL